MLAEIIGIVVNIAKQILVCTEIIGYRYQSGTPAQRRRLESVKIASFIQFWDIVKYIRKSQTNMVQVHMWKCCRMIFAATLNRGRNNHDKILPIFKDERIRDTFSNVYGKRLRALE
mgnify:CR=1 FL=1